MTEIITEGLVGSAIEIASPSIIALGLYEQCGWGPNWVVAVVNIPQYGICKAYTIGMKTAWLKAWGPEVDFEGVACRKLEVTMRTNMRSSEVVAQYPWLLKPGDFFYGGATLRPGGLYAAVSGKKSQVDEAAAETILLWIEALARIRSRNLQENGVKQL